MSLTNRDDVVVSSINLIQQGGFCDLGDNLIETVATLPNKADKTTVCEKVQTYNQTEVNYLVSSLSDTGMQQNKS